MNTLIERIQESGVKTGNDLPADISVLPHYKGNNGFFHIVGNGWELCLIKGVYKNNIRFIDGQCPYDNKKINELAQRLADIERNLRTAVSLKVYCDKEEDFYISEAEEYSNPESNCLRDYTIESPLTNVEKSLGKGDMVNEKHLFIRSPFTEIAPEVLSPVTMSFFAGIPDVMNPLFMSCSIKVQSPSVKLLFGRLYLNMTNIETILPTFKQTADLFLMNYAPVLFKTIKKPLFGIPNDSDLKISDEEVLDAVKEIETIISELTHDGVFGEQFTELAALTVMTWEMIYIRLWKSFTSFNKLLGKDFSEALLHIYKTRSDSILNADLENISENIDPVSKSTNIKSLDLQHYTTEEMFKTLGSAKRLTMNKSKYMQKLSECHTYLKMRDELYLSIMKLTNKLRGILLEYGQKMVDDSMLTNVDDIFYFEMREISNIINDEFYGNIPFTINFRKWQNARLKALCLPYNLYEKDVEQADEIAMKQINNAMTGKTLSCLSHFHKEMQTDNAAVERCCPLSKIGSLVNKDIIVTESASIFSFITEYCAVSEKPLYYGARFAELLLQGKTISTKENELTYE